MIEIIEPLANVPGVRMAALVTEDGVPVAVPGRHVSEASSPAGAAFDENALAALSAGWLAELTRAAGGLSWGTPRRAVLRAARGTLLILRTSGAVLLVVLEGGLGPEELWLPMEGVAARIRRVMRGISSAGEGGPTDGPPPALPSRASSEGAAPESPLTTGRDSEQAAGN